MPFEDTVNTVAGAIGFNGRCYDYLFDTLAGIKEYGIHDAADGETGKCRVSEACINRIIWVGTSFLLGIAAVAEW